MRIVIFSNGTLDHPEQDHGRIQPEDIIFAADGGVHHCMALGLIPDLLIGDLDSVDRDLVTRLSQRGAEVQEHPERKDQTDLELALEVAVERHADEIIILGGLGERWDQTLANILLLTQARFQGSRIKIVDGPQEIHYVQTGEILHIHANRGATVSLIPIQGQAKGIITTGLEYELMDGTLSFGTTRGVSNVVIEEHASVQIQEGALICIVIDELDR